jgi:large subunit ribosomal protein L29
MNESDTNSKLIDLKKELMKINSQIAIGTVPKSPGKVREIKRTIARILSVNNEKVTIKNKKQQKGGSKKE